MRGPKQGLGDLRRWLSAVPPAYEIRLVFQIPAKDERRLAEPVEQRRQALWARFDATPAARRAATLRAVLSDATKDCPEYEAAVRGLGAVDAAEKAAWLAERVPEASRACGCRAELETVGHVYSYLLRPLGPPVRSIALGLDDLARVDDATPVGALAQGSARTIR